MAEQVLINPKSDACWETLDRVQKYRMEAFANGEFDLGVTEPERFKIESHEQLVHAFYWACSPLRDNTAGYELANSIFKQHLRLLLR